MPQPFEIIPEFKTSFWRWGVALGIDCMAASSISSMLGSNLFVWILSFLLIWMGLRVVVTAYNQGQTLG